MDVGDVTQHIVFWVVSKWTDDPDTNFCLIAAEPESGFSLRLKLLGE